MRRDDNFEKKILKKKQYTRYFTIKLYSSKPSSKKYYSGLLDRKKNSKFHYSKIRISNNENNLWLKLIDSLNNNLYQLIDKNSSQLVYTLLSLFNNLQLKYHLKLAANFFMISRLITGEKHHIVKKRNTNTPLVFYLILEKLNNLLKDNDYSYFMIVNDIERSLCDLTKNQESVNDLKIPQRYPTEIYKKQIDLNTEVKSEKSTCEYLTFAYENESIYDFSITNKYINNEYYILENTENVSSCSSKHLYKTYNRETKFKNSATLNGTLRSALSRHKNFKEETDTKPLCLLSALKITKLTSTSNRKANKNTVIRTLNIPVHLVPPRRVLAASKTDLKALPKRKEQRLPMPPKLVLRKSQMWQRRIHGNTDL